MNYFKRKYLEFNSYLIHQAKDRIQFALDTDVRAMIDSEITKQLNYARAESKSIFIIELESFAESRLFEEMMCEMVRQYDFRDLVKAEIKLLANDSALGNVLEDMPDDIINKLNDSFNNQSGKLMSNENIDKKQGVMVKLPQDFKRVGILHTPKTWREVEDWVEALPMGETRGMARIALYMAWNFWVSKLKEWEIEHE